MDPTDRQTSFPGIGARQTVKRVPTKQPGNSVHGPESPRLDGNIPHNNHPKHTNDPKADDSPNKNCQPRIDRKYPARGSELGQISSLEQDDDSSQQQSSTQEAVADQAQNVEQVDTSN